MPRLATPSRPSLVARAALGAIVLAGTTLAACGGAGAPTSSPVPTVTPTTTLTAAPTAAPATVKPAAGPVAIADGTYDSEPIDVADWRAAIEADDKLTAAQKAEIVGPLFQLAQHKSIVVRLELRKGSWVQSAAFDGGAFDVGSRATYAFPDASTVIISEECCGLTTFTVTPHGDGFRLTRISGTQNTELDIITGALIFGSKPFHRTAS